MVSFFALPLIVLRPSSKHLAGDFDAGSIDEESHVVADQRSQAEDWKSWRSRVTGRVNGDPFGADEHLPFDLHVGRVEGNVLLVDSDRPNPLQPELDPILEMLRTHRDVVSMPRVKDGREVRRALMTRHHRNRNHDLEGSHQDRARG